MHIHTLKMLLMQLMFFSRANYNKFISPTFFLFAQENIVLRKIVIVEKATHLNSSQTTNSHIWGHHHRFCIGSSNLQMIHIFSHYGPLQSQISKTNKNEIADAKYSYCF